MNVHQLRPGSRVGPYEIVRLLGRGGMGVVYEANATASGERVALKFILSSDPKHAERFRREAKLAARVSHPNVARILDAAEHGVPCIAFEFLPGGSLSDRLDRVGPLPWREAASLGAQIARGIAAIHAEGLVHRDLKPANVLLDAAGRAKVADFGLARTVGKGTIELTKTGELVGTLEYMAPEQADGSKVDARADLYALGAVLFALVTGSAPFTGSGIALIAQHIQEVPPRLRSVEPSAPAALDALVARLLSKHPQERGDAIEVARELDAIANLADETGSRRGPLLAGIGAVALVAVGLVIAVGRSRGPAAPGPGSSPAPSVSPFALPLPTVAPSPEGPRALPDGALVALAPPPGPDADVLARLRLTTNLSFVREPAPFGRVGHRDRPTRALFLADGRALSAGLDGRLILWDAAKGTQVASVLADPAGIADATVAPSGEILAAGRSGVLGRWRLANGALERVATLVVSSSPLTAVAACSADTVFAGGERGLFRIRLATAGVRALDPHPVSALRAIPGGILVGAVAGSVDAWTEAGARARTVHEGTAPIAALDLSPDGRRFLALEGVDAGGGDPRALLIRELEHPERGTRLEPPAWSRAACFTGDGAAVFVADSEGAIAVLPTAGGVSRELAGKHLGRVVSLARSSDGTKLLSASTDHTLKVWDLATETDAVTCPGSPPVVALATTRVGTRADGDLLAIAYGDPRVVRYRPSSGQSDSSTPVGSCRAVAISPVEGWVASAHDDGRARVWSFPPAGAISGAVVPVVEAVTLAPTVRIGAEAFLADGRLVTGSDDGRLRLFHPRDPPEHEDMNPCCYPKTQALTGSAVVGLAAGENGVLSCGADAVVTWWHVEPDSSRILRGPFLAVKGARVVALAGDRAVVGGEDGTVALLAVGGTSIARAAVLAEHGRPVASVAVSGDLALSASADGTVRLVDVAARSEVARVDLAGCDDAPTAVAFSPDGRSFFVGTSRGAVLELALPKSAKR